MKNDSIELSIDTVGENEINSQRKTLRNGERNSCWIRY